MGLLSPLPLRPENRGYAPLFKVLNEIRTWLDSERIEPIRFKMVVGRSGLGFEISFRSEREASVFGSDLHHCLTEADREVARRHPANLEQGVLSKQVRYRNTPCRKEGRYAHQHGSAEKDADWPEVHILTPKEDVRWCDCGQPLGSTRLLSPNPTQFY
jgi:hypothetical protein